MVVELTLDNLLQIISVLSIFTLIGVLSYEIFGHSIKKLTPDGHVVWCDEVNSNTPNWYSEKSAPRYLQPVKSMCFNTSETNTESENENVIYLTIPSDITDQLFVRAFKDEEKIIDPRTRTPIKCRCCGEETREYLYFCGITEYCCNISAYENDAVITQPVCIECILPAYSELLESDAETTSNFSYEKSAIENL